MSNYKVNKLTEACVEFVGPGLAYYGTYPSLALDEHAAEYVARLLSKAYHAGRQDKASEIRSALGVSDPIRCA